MPNLDEANAMLDAFLEPGRNVSRSDLESMKALLGDNASQSNHFQKRAEAMRKTEEGKAPGAIHDNRTGADDVMKTHHLLGGDGSKNPQEPNPDENPGHGAGDGDQKPAADDQPQAAKAAELAAADKAKADEAKAKTASKQKKE